MGFARRSSISSTTCGWRPAANSLVNFQFHEAIKRSNFAGEQPLTAGELRIDSSLVNRIGAIARSQTPVLAALRRWL
jgi:hypothetical protein